MLNICDDIEELKGGYAIMSAMFATKATYGRSTEALFADLLRLNSYIDTLERNIPTTEHIKSAVSMEGQKIPLSALIKQNNNLILNTEHFSSCSEIESRRCLSDEEICVIVERGKRICNKYT